MFDAALRLRYERPIPGREAKGLEVFADGLTLFGKLAADGHCAEPEVFHLLFGGGETIVKTESVEKAVEILEMEEVRRFIETALYTADDFDIEIMVTGDKVMENMATFGEVGRELGYV